MSPARTRMQQHMLSAGHANFRVRNGASIQELTMPGRSFASDIKRGSFHSWGPSAQATLRDPSPPCFMSASALRRNPLRGAGVVNGNVPIGSAVQADGESELHPGRMLEPLPRHAEHLGRRRRVLAPSRA